ncbi:MAG: hypothetical protein K0S12_2177 [Bacteroidetes bacterium]|nr:hypothetical protein [Bacteroidota bacterium]
MQKFVFIIFACLPALTLLCQEEERMLKASLKREDSSQVKIRRLGINSESSDFCPYLLNNQLYFVSGRYNENGIVYTDQNNTQTTDIFSCKRTDSVSFSKVKPLSGNINSKLNEGPFCFNRKGDVIYFTSNDAAKLLKIFCSRKTGQQWSAPEEMSFCFPGYSSCHPALAPDEATLIFASNVAGGLGGMDLYMTKLENGKWSKPVNLGPSVNSSFNEVFPFVSASNTLYFSSNKTQGLGGLDVYSVQTNDLKGKITHLKYPVNSRADDFGVFVDSTGNMGYFSSDRRTSTKDDIYFFYKWIPELTEFKTFIPKNKFCFTFFEESFLSGKDTLDLTYEWNFGDGKKERGEKVKHCYEKPGDYNVELNIVQKVSGEIYQSQTSYPLSVEEPDVFGINSVDTIGLGSHVILSSMSAAKKYSVNKTYWSFGDGRYNDGSKVKHKYSKQGNYTVELLFEAKNKKTGEIEKLKVDKKIVVKDQSIYAAK